MVVVVCASLMACSSGSSSTPAKSTTKQNKPSKSSSSAAGSSAAGSAGKGSMAAAPDAGGATASDASVGSSDGWTVLLKGKWQLTAGQETFQCVRKTVDQDLYIHGFRAISPVGTHHTVLSVGAVTGPDGIAGCNGGAAGGFTVPNMIFGSGVGTRDIVFPDGVALKITAGQQLNSNLHLFNTSNEAITGESGNEVLLIAKEDVKYLADNMLAGPLLFSIPPTGQPAVISGNCTMDADTKIFAVQPHMHTLGTHQKVTVQSATQGEILLHDGPYTFDEQVYYSMDPVSVAKGDKVHVDCTFVNTTGKAVTFGESTTNEMCLASVYRYPASGAPHSICAF
jgi:hypothetical protein